MKLNVRFSAKSTESCSDVLNRPMFSCIGFGEEECENCPCRNSDIPKPNESYTLSCSIFDPKMDLYEVKLFDIELKLETSGMKLFISFSDCINYNDYECDVLFKIHGNKISTRSRAYILASKAADIYLNGRDAEAKLAISKARDIEKSLKAKVNTGYPIYYNATIGNIGQIRTLMPDFIFNDTKFTNIATLLIDALMAAINSNPEIKKIVKESFDFIGLKNYCFSTFYINANSRNSSMSSTIKIKTENREQLRNRKIEHTDLANKIDIAYMSISKEAVTNFQRYCLKTFIREFDTRVLKKALDLIS